MFFNRKEYNDSWDESCKSLKSDNDIFERTLIAKVFWMLLDKFRYGEEKGME